MQTSPTTQHDDALWLSLINAVIPFAANGKGTEVRLSDPDVLLTETGLDSLDNAVLGAYLCELFEVPLPLQRDFQPRTAREAIDFLEQHAQRRIESPDDIVRMLETAAP